MSRREMIHEACRVIRKVLDKEGMPISVPSQQQYREIIQKVIALQQSRSLRELIR